MSEFTGKMKNIFYDRTGCRPCNVITYIICALISCVLALVLNFLFNALGLTENEAFQEASDSLMGVSDNPLLLILLYCIVTPLFEEIIFRYFIYNLIDKYTKRAALSILITSALFGIYHMNPVQMLYGFLMGLIITYSYSKYKVITIPFLVHSAANAVALVYTFT